MNVLRSLPCLLLTLMSAGCATSRALEASDIPGASFAIRNVRIFDGEHVIPSGTVVVRGDQIAAVGENIDVSGVDEVIDGQGQTLLPGLIDSHFHTNGPDANKAALAFGVTTVVDLFGQFSAVLDKRPLGELSKRGDDEADSLVSLVITAPGGHGTEYGDIPMPKVSTPEECQAAVNSQLDAGATIVKLIYDGGESWSPKPIPTLSRETLAACIQAAHARGALSVVHAWTLQRAREAIEAGVDGLAHGVIDTPVDAAFAQLIVEHGAFVIPTLAVGAGVTHHHNDQVILSDPQLEPYLSPNSMRDLKTSFPDWFGQGMHEAVQLESIRTLKAAHVPILAGSDSFNPQTAVGATLHQEMEMLVGAGLTPTEALMAATSLPAARFRQADRGRIAPGLRADLLLVQGDPTKDIRVTRDIVAVWKRGKKLDRQAFRARMQAALQGTVSR